MKGRTVTFAALLALCAAPIAMAADTLEYKGVTFSTRWSRAGLELELRGTGSSYYMMFWRVSACALYLPADVPSANAITDVAKRLQIHYFYGITKAQFAKMTMRGIRKNTTAGEFEMLQPRVEQFNALYEDVAKGDEYTLTYVPRAGTELALNGRTLGTIQGSDFAHALFSIWLGEKPFQDELKRGLLDL